MNKVALEQHAQRWFGVIELDDAEPPVLDALSELLRMLEMVQPALIDASRNSIRTKGHGWSVRKGAEIRLVHAADEEATITLVIGRDEAILSWYTAHEHVHLDEGTKERPWTTVLVDATAGVLRGQYEVENHYKGSRLVKTSVIDTQATDDDRVVGQTFTLISSWLPIPANKRVERRKLDYGASG